MSRVHALAILLLIGSVLAGCAGNSDDTDSTRPADEISWNLDWALDALPYGDEHDHLNVTQHSGLSTPNFEIVGYDPLISDATDRTNGGHFCGDTATVPGGRRIAAVESRTIGGFVLIDVTEPGKPQRLGELVMPNTRVYDLSVVPDGKHVVLVTTYASGAPRPPTTVATEPAAVWRPACGHAEIPLFLPIAEDPVPRHSSAILVNIEDPQQPRVVDQRPIPLDGHSAFTTILDGRTWVLITVYGVVDEYYQFYEIVTTPAGSVLSHLSTYALDEGQDTPRTARGHDGWIAKHPQTGQTLAYLAGGEELRILDLADPYRPEVIGRWSDWTPERSGSAGKLHSILPVKDLWDGRHYSILGPEWGNHPQDQPSGTIWVLDTTDPAQPTEVAAWTLPHDVVWNGTYMFSNHYYTVHNRTLFVSMYHGGIWAIDLAGVRPDSFTLAPSIGVFLPTNESPKPPPKLTRWTPTVEDVIAFEDGSIVLFDGMSGLYVVRFDPTRPAPTPDPWPIPPVP